MPRALLCLSIVAAFSLRLTAADTVGTTVPVSLATMSVLGSHAVTPDTDPARFLPELARLLHAGTEPRVGVLDALRRLQTVRDPEAGAPAFLAWLPVGTEVWSRAIFKRTVQPDALVTAIVTDRRAALLLHGLASLDDETLEYFAAHPTLLTHLHERGAPAFGALSASLRIRDGRIVAHGDPASVRLWEAVVGASVGEPERFVSLLFSKDEGRIAYLYDTVGHLDPPNVAFALGATLAPTTRLARFQALAAVAIHQYGDWKVELRPFSRPVHDLSLLLMRARVDADGTLASPADRSFWSEVFEMAAASGDAVATLAASESAAGPASGPVDAAWLAHATSAGSIYRRGDRIDQLTFAQRVFADLQPSDRALALETVKLFPMFRMLMLTLERVGIRKPSAFVHAARRAARLNLDNGGRSFGQVAQLQSALALVARLRKANTFDLATTERVVHALFAVPADEHGRFAGALARWLSEDLLPRLPRADDAETRIIVGMAGRSAGADAPRVLWEGQAYRVDPARAEVRRMRAVRGKQGGYTVDLATALDDVVRRLVASPSGDDLSAATSALSSIRQRFSTELDRVVDVLPSGVVAQRTAREIVERVLADLSRARDDRRATRAMLALTDLIGVVLGEALLTLNYTAELGSPDGAALLARNVALRHDFGLGHHGGDRVRFAWSLPRQNFQPGVPWHVAGSALGLDVALARMSLTLINGAQFASAPRLSSLDRDGFAVNVALLRANALRDRDLDAIRSAIERGRERVQAMALGTADEAFGALADTLRLSGWRRRAMRQAVADDPRRAPELFTLAELLTLGGVPTGTDLDAWGASGLQTAGCLCTRLLSPRSWPLLTGRAQLALGSAATPDLHLRVAVMLSELGLPAVIAPSVLAAAVEDFVGEVAPGDAHDWWTLARWAAAISRERIEDYVASAASIDGVLIPEEAVADSRQP